MYMENSNEMRKPVEWIHTIIQSILFLLAIAGMFWNFSTSQQKTKDEIDILKYRMSVMEQARHDDAIIYRADMSELKINQKELTEKVNELLVLMQNKKDREK